MGDPRRQKKKYTSPNHPWQGGRIEAEKVLTREFGLVKKKEVWKANSVLQNYKDQAKKAIVSTSKQGEIERQSLLKTLQKYGMITETSGLDDVLGLTVNAVLERRLQTQVLRKKLAGSMKQARQFILHGHIQVNGKKMTAPSYLLSVAEESGLGYSPKSKLFSESHPEREKALQEKKVKVRPEKDDRRFRRRR